jgi:hypothetical protein
VVVAAFVAGIGVTSVFALSVLGATRLADMRKEGRSVAAGTYAVVTIVGFAACVAAVVLGIVEMTRKS